MSKIKENKNNLNKNDNYLKIKEYEKKILDLEKIFELIVQLNSKKNIERENNKIKIKNELDKGIKEIKLEIDNHKNNMLDKIDNCFSQIQNTIIYKMQNKKIINNDNYIQMEKLNNIIKNEIPKIYKVSNNLKIKNKENVEKMKNILNKEINNIKQNIILNEQKMRENEILMNDIIGKEIEQMIKVFSMIKTKREEYEQNMFSQINDIVVKMKYALG